MSKFLCKECEWQGWERELLHAPNPFAEDDIDTMTGCPNCRQPNAMRLACTEQDCWEAVTCGINTPAGYRRVCSEHFHDIERAMRSVVAVRR